MKVHDDILLLQSTVNMPLLKLDVTTTALRTSRGVLVIGPGKKIREQETLITALGRVTDLIAPNLLHHISLLKAIQTFPQATIWGVDGFKEKRPDIPWDKVLDETTWSYSDEVQVIRIQGMPKMQEAVFYHIESKTLVVTDLFFNLTDAKGIGAWVILNLFGTYRRFGISSFYLRAVKDRGAFEASLREIAKLDFDKIVVAHGKPVLKNARDLFDRALRERKIL